MHQAIPPVPINPLGNTEAFVQVLCTGGGIFMATPREFDTRGFKTVKSPGRQDACFIPSRWRLLWEKLWISSHSGLSAKDWTSLLRFLETSLLILESFPALYRSNYLSYIIYRKIKETYAANKKCISLSTNTEWTF